MKTKYLTHRSGVKFQFIGEVELQFAGMAVELLNLKSGKVERFNANTYLQFFTESN